MVLIARRNIALIFVAVLCNLSISLAEDEEEKEPCGAALCEGFDRHYGFTIAQNSITFRKKYVDTNDDACGIMEGFHCNDRKQEDSGNGNDDDDDDDTMEQSTTTVSSDVTDNTNSTASVATTTEQVEETPGTTATPLFMGQRSVARHNDVTCMDVSKPTIVGWFKLERIINDIEFELSGQKLSKDAEIEPDCELKDDVIPASVAMGAPTREVQVSTFNVGVKFAGVSDGTKAPMTVDFSIIKEYGNYTEDNKTYEVRGGEVKISFNVTDATNWFCDSAINTCADYVRLCFDVRVSDADTPTGDIVTETECVNNVCTKNADITDHTKLRMLGTAIKSGARMTLPEDYFHLGLTSCVRIAQQQTTETFSFDVYLTPSPEVDEVYKEEVKEEQKKNPPGSGNPGDGTNTSQVPTTAASYLSILALLLLALIISV